VRVSVAVAHEIVQNCYGTLYMYSCWYCCLFSVSMLHSHTLVQCFLQFVSDPVFMSPMTKTDIYTLKKAKGAMPFWSVRHPSFSLKACEPLEG